MDIESLLNEPDAPTGTVRDSVSRKSSSQISSSNHHSPDRLSRIPTSRSDAPQNTQFTEPILLLRTGASPTSTSTKTDAMAAHAAPPHLPYYTQQQPLYMNSLPPDTTDPNLAPASYLESAASQDTVPPFPPSRKTNQSGNQSLECKQCQKSFSRRSDLVRHERIHTGDRPHPCPQLGCQKSFIQRSALTVHMRTHTGDKPHRCDQCSKPFSDSSSLARHRRTHTGLRPYQCDYCKKDFTRRTTLKRHMEQHGDIEQASQSAPTTEDGGIPNVPLQQTSQQSVEPTSERPRKRQNRNVTVPNMEQPFHPTTDFQQPPAGLGPEQNLLHHGGHLSQQHHSPTSPTSYPISARSNLADGSRTTNAPPTYTLQDQSQMYKPDPGTYPPLDDDYQTHVPHTYYQQPAKQVDHNESSYYSNPYDWQPAPNQCKNQFGNGWEPR